MTIVTTECYPGWFSAIDSETYDGPESPLGLGRTEQEAIADLLDKMEGKE